MFWVKVLSRPTLHPLSVCCASYPPGCVCTPYPPVHVYVGCRVSYVICSVYPWCLFFWSSYVYVTTVYVSFVFIKSVHIQLSPDLQWLQAPATLFECFWLILPSRTLHPVCAPYPPVHVCTPYSPVRVCVVCRM